MNQDIWTVKGDKFKVQVGDYEAVFLGVTEFDKPEFGITGKWRWTWRTSAGVELSRLTNRVMANKSSAGQLLTGMLRRSLVPGVDVRAAIAGLVGKRFVVTVAEGPQGGKPQVRHAVPMD